MTDVPSGEPSTVLEVEHLKVSFRSGGILGGRRVVRAVDDVSFTITEGETLGLVGESGSGKSTTGRAVLGLVKADSGRVVLAGREVTEMGRRELRRARSQMQMVFQDPYSSLDPSMVVADSVAEPLEVHEGLRGAARDERVTELFETVGLSKYHLQRYPYEFSGGQRQRVAIARALALNPKLVICDEAVSALDVSTQNQIINLLEGLQREFGVAYLFIAHDLAVVRHISHRTAVMYLGKLVEEGPTDRVYDQAAHPYSEALLSAIPVPNPRRARAQQRVVLEGDIPDPAAVPPGCAFHTRCPYAMDVCKEVPPQMTPIDGGGQAACHLQTHGPALAGAPLTALGDRRAGATRSGGAPAGTVRAGAASAGTGS